MSINDQAIQILQSASQYIKDHGWSGNLLQVLQAVHTTERWDQDLAVTIYAAITYELGSETLTQFESRVTSPQEFIDLLERTIAQLSQTSS